MRWALLMNDIRLTRSLLEQGYDYGDLRRLQRGSELSAYGAAPTHARTKLIRWWRNGIGG